MKCSKAVECIGKFSAALLYGEESLILVLITRMWKSTEQKSFPF